MFNDCWVRCYPTGLLRWFHNSPTERSSSYWLSCKARGFSLEGISRGSSITGFISKLTFCFQTWMETKLRVRRAECRSVKILLWISEKVVSFLYLVITKYVKRLERWCSVKSMELLLWGPWVWFRHPHQAAPGDPAPFLWLLWALHSCVQTHIQIYIIKIKIKHFKNISLKKTKTVWPALGIH